MRVTVVELWYYFSTEYSKLKTLKEPGAKNSKYQLLNFQIVQY